MQRSNSGWEGITEKVTFGLVLKNVLEFAGWRTDCWPGGIQAVPNLGQVSYSLYQTVLCCVVEGHQSLAVSCLPY